MPGRRVLRRVLAVLAAVVVLATAALPGAASAHSLESSTVAVRVGEDGVSATISVALETVDEALGTDHSSEDDVSEYADEVIAYIDEHLTVTGADGAAWAEAYGDAAVESVEGITSFTVDVVLGGDAATGDFTLTYDAVIEAVPAHEAVVVLTDADGEISTAGVLDASHASVAISGSGQAVPVGDVVRYGFHHVLEGADHLLFLFALLLPAPLIAAGGRWRRGRGALASAWRVVHVVTAFTIGHSLTLIAAALGWVAVPGRPVEVLIAASVAIAAVHAIRPLAARGEAAIALGFGLVHGLAFAGILAGLGIDGSASIASLLAFNVGVELAQLAAVAAVLPSLLVLSRTRLHAPLRVGAASLALAAAAGWALERLGLLGNPLGAVEDAAMAHLVGIAGVLAALALAAALLEWRPRGGAPRLSRERAGT